MLDHLEPQYRVDQPLRLRVQLLHRDRQLLPLACAPEQRGRATWACRQRNVGVQEAGGRVLSRITVRSAPCAQAVAEAGGAAAV